MEKKNMVLLTVIAVATLLVAVVGATFAFFASSVQDTRSDADGKGTGNTNIGTANMTSNTTTVVANIDGAAGSFEAENVYPGHKEVAALSVTATSTDAQATASPVSFVYNVTENTIGTNIKVRLYKSSTEVTTDASTLGCTVNINTVEGVQQFSETCTMDKTAEAGKFGTLLKEVTLKGGAEGINLGSDTLNVPAGEGGSATGYYYVVVEYVNTTENQAPTESGKTLAGKILVA